jgi:hypothetical protein
MNLINCRADSRSSSPRTVWERTSQSAACHPSGDFVETSVHGLLVRELLQTDRATGHRDLHPFAVPRPAIGEPGSGRGHVHDAP